MLCAVGRSAVIAAAGVVAASSCGVCLAVAAYPVQVSNGNGGALHLGTDSAAGLLPEGAVLHIQPSMPCTTTLIYLLIMIYLFI